MKLTIAGVILTLASSAYAGGVSLMQESEGKQESKAKFNGLYGGISFGYVKWNGTALSLGPSAFWETPGTSTAYSKTKGAVGGQLGYQTTFDNGFLIGAEIAYTPYKAFQSIQSPTVAGHSDLLTVKDGIASLSARAGYVYNSWLFYGKAGISRTTIEFRVIDTLFHQDYYILSKQQIAANLGLGAEYCFNTNVSLGVDYNYINWGSFSGIGAQSPAGSDAFRVKVKSNITTVRLNYQF